MDLSWPGDIQSGIGIETRYSRYNVFDHVIANNRGTGIRTGYGPGADGNTFQYNTLTGTGVGIRTDGGQGNRFLHNNLSGCGLGLEITNDVQFELEGNDFTGCGGGLSLRHSDGPTLTAGDLGETIKTVPGTPLTLYAVTNAHVSGLDLSWEGDGRSGWGIATRYSRDNTFDHLIINNRSIGIGTGYGSAGGNTFQFNTLRNTEYGIRAADGQGNRFLYNDVSGATNRGIMITHDAQFELEGNDFTGCAGGLYLEHSDGPTLSAGDLDETIKTVPGIALQLYADTNAHISGLDLSWGGVEPSGGGLGLHQSTNTTIEGITVRNRWTGIGVTGPASGGNILLGNVIAGNSGTGVTLHGTQNAVHCGWINGNGTGIYSVPDSSEIVVNHNVIMGNSDYGVRNSSSDAVDASHNYWGAADGPGPGGSGDLISGNVLFDPFATSASELDAPCGRNSPPTADAGGSYNGDEGSAVALDSATASDPDEDGLSFAWTVSDPALCTFSDPTVLNPDLTCTDNGSYVAALSVNDGIHDPVTSEASVTVANVAPTVLAITAPGEPVDINDMPVSVSATFSDPAGDSDAPFTCTVDYDTSDQVGPVAGTVSGFTCTGPDHTYAGPGVYTVSVTVTDKDGATSDPLEYRYIVVYDPDGGFVTGGGWIWSVPEFCDSTLHPACAGAEGKAHFGFVSKYKKGANVPEGNTRFQFKAGDLDFHSSNYDWLVIAGHDKAKFKGTGTINGEGNYGFMLTAVDNGNSGDTFRIKIWNKDAGDGVVYDNKMGVSDDGYDGTAIGGGNIVVHKQ